MWRFTLLMMLSLLTRSVSSQELNNEVTVQLHNLPLEQILDSITYKSGYFFSYNAEALPTGSLYSINRADIQVDSLLSILLVGTELEFLKEGDQIILRKIPKVYDYKVVASDDKKGTFRGWVRQKGTNEPVIGASVFLNGTTIGGITDEKGNYEIKGIPSGTHQLVISFIGFATNSYQIKASGGNTYILNTFLSPKTKELEAVEVISRPLVDSSEWSMHYRAFKKEFIGYSPNSRRCELENPEAIGFTYDQDEDLLKAHAEEPIIVINKSLGYKIQCQLVSFEKRKQETKFHIRALFEDLEASNRRVSKRWNRNRKETYEGSSPHFFKSLITDRIKREGYRCYLIKDKEYKEVDRDEILKQDSTGFNWVLKFDSTLFVRYTLEKETIAYLEHLNETARKREDSYAVGSSIQQEPGDQVSMIELTKKQVILFPNGQVKNPEGLLRLGYWSWERLGDLMPVNYDQK